MTTPTTPPTLRRRAQEYLAMRRALGFKLTTWGAKLLSFVDYLESLGHTVITTEDAVAWATSTPRRSGDPVHWARRLDVVRIFARHLKALDAATEIPPEDVISRRYRRITPYLYSPAEIVALLLAASRLSPPLRAATWQTALGLLAVTGMRVSEACRLDRSDVDLRHGVLRVRDSKFGKSRDVPIHPSTTEVLAGYAHVRDRLAPKPAGPAFFICTRGTRLDAANASRTFTQLLTAAAIAPVPGRRRKRIHDLRHSFSVATLLDWYRAGVDVQAQIPLLATYLGHVDPKSSYWYLTGSPELLELAAARLEHAFTASTSVESEGRP